MALARLLRQAPLTTLLLPDTITDLVEALASIDLLTGQPGISPTPV
jgi:hypothetical protein